MPAATATHETPKAVTSIPPWHWLVGLYFDLIDPDFPGHVIAPNITPDRDTGIGKWSEADIVVALRNGKRPDGSIIGPPMPILVYRAIVNVPQAEQCGGRRLMAPSSLQPATG